MRKTIKNGVTFVEVDGVNEEILVELKTSCIDTIVHGYIALSYMRLWNRYNLMDDDEMTFCVNDGGKTEPEMFMVIRRTGRIFQFENPRVSNNYPACVTTTWGHLKTELQKFELA